MLSKPNKILFKKFSDSKNKGFHNEALILSYHLNLNILLEMLRKADPGYQPEGKKVKHLLRDLEKVLVFGENKSLLSKKNFKAVKTWGSRMETYFKSLKIALPQPNKRLLLESEQVFALLSISSHKRR